jgi:hypothetical protein
MGKFEIFILESAQSKNNGGINRDK